MNLGINSSQSNNINGMLGNVNRWGTNNGLRFNNLAPHYEIPQVNGEAGAKNFQMAPNSNYFLIDSSTPNLLWLVQTDGAGYLTATPWDVLPHQFQPPVDINNLEQRIKNLEEMYASINTGTTKSKKRNANANANTNTESADATN